MNDHPLVRQSEAADAQLPAPIRVRDGEQVAPVVPAGGGRFGIKKPRFAVTLAKLHDAALHRWKLAVVVGMTLAVVGFGIAWFTYAPKYTASSSMRMESGERRLLPVNEDRRANHETEFRKTQSIMIKGRKVLEEVVKKNNVRVLSLIRRFNGKDPVLWLEKELQAGFVNDTSIFRLSLSGEEPEEVAILVNEVMKVFKEQFVVTVEEEKKARYSVISEMLDRAEKKIEKTEKDFKNLARTLRTGDSQTLTYKQKMALDDYSALNRELLLLDSEFRKTDGELFVHKGALAAQTTEEPPAELIDEIIDRYPIVQKMQFELNALKSQMQEYKKKVVAEANPRLAQFQADLKAAEAELQKKKIDLRPEVLQKARAESLQKRSIAVGQTNDKIEMLKKQKAELLKVVLNYRAEAEAIGLAAIELEEFCAQIAWTETMRKSLQAEKDRLDFERQNSLPMIAAESPAIVPTVNQASMPLHLSLYSVAGFIFGFLGVSFLEARSCRLHKPAEVRRDLGIDTLGVMPILDLNRTRVYGRSSTTDPARLTDLFTESVNGLCATILCDDRLKSKAVLMVTSASESEGKTFLASHLAVGFARAGRKTLLMDCDLRNPRCHERIGLPSGPGLSEVLRGEVELAAAVQTIPGRETHFLGVGVSDFQVVQALSNGAFESLLVRLRAEYDCIIVDSAPTLIVSDGLLIGKMVDGVILVVRSKVSKAPCVFSAYEQLLGLKIRILGAIVNGAKTQSSSYYAR